MQKQSEPATLALQTAFTTIVTHVPLRHRLSIESSITTIQKALRLPSENLCFDRRSLRSDPESSNRKKYRATIKQTILARKKFLISYHDSDGWTEPEPISLDQILRKTKWKAAYFHSQLSRQKGTIDWQLNGQLVKITRRDAL